MVKGQEEFYVSLIIIGGVIFAGLLIMVVLLYWGYKLYNYVFKKKVINELYNEKERKNGQHKGGSRGQY